MRDSKWKLLVNKEQEKLQLFDLEKDWAEKTDVAADFPKVVQELSEKLDSWKASLPTTPSKNGLSNARKKVLKK